MSPRVELAYGETPRTIEVCEGSTIARPPLAETPSRTLDAILADALARPIGCPPLEELACSGRNVLIIVSDCSRDEPRAEMLAAIRDRLSEGAHVRVAIANGTHEPRARSLVGLPEWAQSAINHNSREFSNIVHIGTTPRGTPLRLNRVIQWADLIIATGALRPHYFAGYGGGIKALFPGLGENDAVRINHRLKAEPGARAGNVDSNPCRDDLEQLLPWLAARCFMLNVIEDSAGAVCDAVAGDIVLAHREGAARCRPLFETSVRESAVVVVSDRPPISRSLYQACKTIAAVAPVVSAGGTIVVAVDCRDGVGDGGVQVVNEAIYELGIRPRLAANVRVVLSAESLLPFESALFCDVVVDFAPLLVAPVVVVPTAGASLLLTP